MNLKRTTWSVGAVAAAGYLTFFLVTSADSQTSKGVVVLQATTPGTAQVGHANVNGTVRAGQFVGGGAGVTGVNASQLGGLAANQYGLLNNNNTWTGINGFSSPSNSFTGVGTGLTALNASNLGSGTVPGGRLTGTYGNALTFNNAANSFTGNGAGLTGVNADLLDGINSTAFLQAVPNPLILSGNSNSGLIQLSNTTNGFYSSALAAYQTGNDVHSSTIYAQTDSTNGESSAIEAYNRSLGYGILVSSDFGTGIQASSGSATQPAIFAYNTSSGPAFVANQKAIFNGNVSIGAGDSPAFLLDFAETLGNKISLWGTSQTSHYGFGVQGGLLQIMAATNTDSIGFGYGGSTAFTETARFTGSAELRFRSAGVDGETRLTTPYDWLIDHDFDNDSTDSWIRMFTNGVLIEQMRINDGDEAATLFDGAVTANGIDYAEAFKISDSTLEAGDLVINAGPEQISRSYKAYDDAVIGVISTKPAFVAGMSFDAEDRMNPDLTRQRDAARARGDVALEKELTKQMRALVLQAYRPVAFMGRVPVKVTGVVNAGDHLTASNIPGYAMAMTRPGHSIGIALQGSDGGKDKIMVMIQPKYFGAATADASAEMRQLRAENAELKARLDRLEQVLKK
ncbi:MAG: hypothetical protein K1X67_11060 [Fimbriimonadaceae bacterium]|nr:hypothetical protein [Fimbriimonadaceae bacterium]